MKKNKNSKVSNTMNSKSKNLNSKSNNQTHNNNEVGFTTTNKENSNNITDCR